jgi:thioredoxin reductase (NADPH)
LRAPFEGLQTLTDSEFDIVVAGAGIAGLTAALTAARLGRRTLIVTGDTLGGHLLTIDKIDGLPGFAENIAGYDLCPIAQEQAMEAGAEIEMASLTALEPSDTGWVVVTANGRHTARAVILATGTALKKLGVPGETEFLGKGVSHCASCDAPLMRDQDVVVAGGGDSALQEALTLAEHCASVTIVHHGERFSAQAAYVAAVEAKANVFARPNTEVSTIVGDAAVTSAWIRSLSDDDENELSCAGVFIFVGLAPNTSYVADHAELDDTGRIVTDSELRTRARGLLAAGTVRSASAGRAAAAAGDGATAALTADRYLTDGSWLAAD